MTAMRLLWLSPSAGLWPSSVLEHRVADALARDGVDVTMIRCDGVLDRFCPVMQAERMSPSDPRRQRHQACRECRFNRELTREDAAYDTVFLDGFADASMRGHARSIAQAATPSTWRDIEIDGIPVGRYATYLTMLNHKVDDPAATPEAWTEYLADLETAVLALQALPAAFASFRPTHGVVYNPLYPVHRMFAELCRRQGVQLAAISAGAFVPDRYGTLAIYPGISSSQTAVDSATIEGSMDQPLSGAEVELVSRNLDGLMSGLDPWVYSSRPTRAGAAEIRGVLGIPHGSPVAVALVASPDETRASMLVDAEYERVPASELSDVPEFIAMVLAAAQETPDISYVIRLHPRLAPNKREALESPDLGRITAMLAQRPTNVFVNHPGDGVGLYDAMRIASCGINQSSSAALEFLALGIPVVHYDAPRANAYPPRSFGYVVPRHDPLSLASAVRAAAAQRTDPRASVTAFRWYAVTLGRALTRLQDRGDDPVQSPVVQSPTAQARRSAIGTAARRIVPQRIGERIARRRARTARAGGRAWAEPLPQHAVEEIEARLEDLSPRVIWDPLVYRRGEGAPDEERLVRGAVARLREAAGLSPAPGDPR